MYAKKVAAHLECRAIAPHSFLPGYLEDHIKEEREAALAFGLSVLKLCKNNDSVQNRFTAYLVAAVINKRIHYMEKQKKQYEREFSYMDMQEKNYSDFDIQFHDYIGEQTAFVLHDWERFEELLVMLESEKLLKAIDKLKERDRRLLFARVFGELTFTELGEKFDMKPKQAEMAYYYVIRKLRKELEVSLKNEF